MSRINFKAQQIEPLDKGSYVLEVNSMEIKKSGPQAKHPGSEYIETEFGVKLQDGSQRKLFHNFSLLPQAGFNLKEFLEAANVVHEAIPGAGKGEFDLSFDTQDCIGKQVAAEVDQETYTNKQGQPSMRNTINKFMQVS